MKKLSLVLTGLVCFVSSLACTTFFLHKNGQMVFGRNYDWLTETGMINTNLRGMKKTSLELEKGKTTSWIAKYGSMTFNQYGKEFPTGGMNEKGLVVELMWLSESEFPAPDDRPALSVLQWIQYQLDNCATIDEVISTDNRVRIMTNGAPQHYLVADAQGNAATIEFLNGKMVVHKGNALPYAVLTNSTYQQSVKSVRNLDSTQAPVRFDDNSLERFQKACSMVKQFNEAKTSKPLVDYSFDILNAVSQGSFTKWTIVYDITNKKIHFRTAGYKDIKTIDMNGFDLSCSSTSLAFNMSQAIKGDITKKFITYSDEVNKNKLQEAFEESKGRISIDQASQDAMAAVASAVTCKQ